jgi:hypothetical protein
MITLLNTTKVAKTYNIPCSPQCNNGEGCLCTEVTTKLADDLPDGTRGIKEVTRRLPGSVTIRAGVKRTFEDWVAEAPAIQRALTAKHLRLVK